MSFSSYSWQDLVLLVLVYWIWEYWKTFSEIWSSDRMSLKLFLTEEMKFFHIYYKKLVSKTNYIFFTISGESGGPNIEPRPSPDKL